MDDHTAKSRMDESPFCDTPFLLCQLQAGKKDRLGNQVEDILWVARNYAIYRSKKGVEIQFSDDPKEEGDQRRRFTAICPELCELRYFTPQISSAENGSLFDHNIAQAMMLVMEGRADVGRRIAQEALNMAVERVTNDNTIRYVRVCLISWIGCILFGFGLLALSSCLWLFGSNCEDEFKLYVVSGLAGATGAILSVATRLQAFRLRPCNQSNMNYWMSAMRVGVGVIAGLVLFLLAPAALSPATKGLLAHGGNSNDLTWHLAAALGFVAGFAERLVPTIMRWTGEQTKSSFGTPSQAVRSEEQLGKARQSKSAN
jgi:hypothetical protein